MKNIFFFVLVVFGLTFGALADNINITQGSGKTLAADDVSGVNFQRFKVTLGADGQVQGDLSDTNRMPIKTNRTDGFAGTNETDIAGTAAVEIVAAGATGVRHYVETLIVANSHPTIGTIVQLLDGATVKAQCPAGPGYGGCVVNFPTPIRGTAATGLSCKNLTTGAAVRCTLTGFDLSE